MGNHLEMHILSENLRYAARRTLSTTVLLSSFSSQPALFLNNYSSEGIR